MNTTCQIIAAIVCALALPITAQAGDRPHTESAQPAQAAPAGKPPVMADMPFMKEEAKRLAALMERLQKETDPAERRKIMAETTCAQ